MYNYSYDMASYILYFKIEITKKNNLQWKVIQKTKIGIFYDKKKYMTQDFVKILISNE
jgi:hypothetical protein